MIYYVSEKRTRKGNKTALDTESSEFKKKFSNVEKE